MALTRKDLTIHLHTQLGMDKRAAKKLVDRLFEIMRTTLSQGEDLLISGFGKFSVKQKKARPVRNPQTKESLILSPRKVVVFKCSGVLRRRINEGYELID